MANSLRVKLKKLCYDGKIEQSELDVLLSKLDGHDQQIRNDVIEEVIELIDSYPNDLCRKTEETHLIFATLSDIITHIRQIKEIENEM